MSTKNYFVMTKRADEKIDQCELTWFVPSYKCNTEAVAIHTRKCKASIYMESMEGMEGMAMGVVAGMAGGALWQTKRRNRLSWSKRFQ
ncbi:193_t:CDS:2 [Ambispora leptoticha]|uniref:193_t:CDS:1 n=1 Tax=Ambispora leptoticha TaxID=144679 RepID=A0A9N9AJ95_9GLOM|nr:193_t:CDS:2 [Ambispora leptoticha]